MVIEVVATLDSVLNTCSGPIVRKPVSVPGVADTVVAVPVAVELEWIPKFRTPMKLQMDNSDDPTKVLNMGRVWKVALPMPVTCQPPGDVWTIPATLWMGTVMVVTPVVTSWFSMPTIMPPMFRFSIPKTVPAGNVMVVNEVVKKF